jgi:hypothetical protein
VSIGAVLSAGSYAFGEAAEILLRFSPIFARRGIAVGLKPSIELKTA